MILTYLLPQILERLVTGLQQANVTNFLVLSSLLFVIGVAGVLTRRNIIIIFMSIELILNAVNINLIAFSRYWQTQNNPNAYMGQLFTIFVIVVAAAEAAVGLGVVIALYRNRETVSVDEIDIMKW
ncbi:MAG: NADH-quinone oxidoreductase subunit NuoK [Acidobacteriota bacterium]